MLGNQPDGPLVGYRMSLPTGKPLRWNRRRWRGRISPGGFPKIGSRQSEGARPARVKLKDIQLEAASMLAVGTSRRLHPASWVVRDGLPRELMKSDTSENENSGRPVGITENSDRQRMRPPPGRTRHGIITVGVVQNAPDSETL
jgi:hypothetical protein